MMAKIKPEKHLSDFRRPKSKITLPPKPPQQIIPGKKLGEPKRK